MDQKVVVVGQGGRGHLIKEYGIIIHNVTLKNAFIESCFLVKQVILWQIDIIFVFKLLSFLKADPMQGP